MSKVLITGANRGIGLAMAKNLSQRGDQVIAVCRQSSAELDALELQIEAGIDVANSDNVRELGERLQGQTLNRLILNAGVLRGDHLGGLDDNAFDAMREQFEVNALGPLRVAATLRNNLGEGSKIGIITSRMGSIADNTSGGNYGYRMSKAAVNVVGRSLAQDLKASGIAVFLLHPGFVQTEMVGGNGDISATDAAANLLARMDELTINDTGTFWHAKGEPLPW